MNAVWEGGELGGGNAKLKNKRKERAVPKTPRHRHVTWRITYHVVWMPKYKRKVLRGCIVETLREAIEEKAQELNAEIITLAIMPGHVRLIIPAPPRISPSEIVGHLRGYTARRLSEEYP